MEEQIVALAKDAFPQVPRGPRQSLSKTVDAVRDLHGYVEHRAFARVRGHLEMLEVVSRVLHHRAAAREAIVVEPPLVDPERAQIPAVRELRRRFFIQHSEARPRLTRPHPAPPDGPPPDTSPARSETPPQVGSTH